MTSVTKTCLNPILFFKNSYVCLFFLISQLKHPKMNCPNPAFK